MPNSATVSLLGCSVLCVELVADFQCLNLRVYVCAEARRLVDRVSPV
jgi:hypothetical protein